ncbi:MAG: hypothetical protein ACI9SC_001020, partial [Gammaproteobacteria bacterium]
MGLLAILILAAEKEYETDKQTSLFCRYHHITVRLWKKLFFTRSANSA